MGSNDVDEIWQELRTIRERLHNWAATIGTIDMLKAHVSKLQKQHDEIVPEMAVLNSQLHDLILKLNYDKTAIRWNLTIAISIYSIAASICTALLINLLK